MVLMAAIGYLAGILVLLAFSFVWKGYVLSILWGWFVSPVFGIGPISVVQAVGLAMVVGFLTHQITRDDEEKEGFAMKFMTAVARAVVYPAMTLGVGWVAHQFV